MDGKTLIHPSQVEPCNEVFSPSDEEVAWSRKIIAAFKAAAECRGQGRDHGRGPHGREAACRDGRAHGGDRRGHQGAQAAA